jgi:undecaprenyl phosphate N,N'-diacetylbacillosamine 1-phosphate transferase
MGYLRLKRIIDFILSVITLIIISPILLLTMLTIKIESKGPVIFKQERLGLNGKVFKMYKFRSMYVGAERGGVYEKENDVRVTKIGKLIRKTSIDELPQLLNIIKGDMALIGPRPTLTYHPWPYEEYTSEQKKRFGLRPGITGWAQINGRKDVPWGRRINYDVEYVENCSFVFDLNIFFKTIIKVLTMQDNVNVEETTKVASIGMNER